MQEDDLTLSHEALELQADPSPRPDLQIPKSPPGDQPEEDHPGSASSARVDSQAGQQSESAPDPKGWKRNSLGLRTWHKCALIIATIAFILVWVLAAFSVLNIPLVRVLALSVGVLGAALRFGAHGQNSTNWKFADLFGKFLAYYGAFTLLFFVGFN